MNAEEWGDLNYRFGWDKSCLYVGLAPITCDRRHNGGWGGQCQGQAIQRELVWVEVLAHNHNDHISLGDAMHPKAPSSPLPSVTQLHHLLYHHQLLHSTTITISPFTTETSPC